MGPENNKRPQQQPETNENAVNIGNASNPSPRPDELEPMNDNRFLSEGAEKYLREVASVEDYPDAADQQDMDDTMKKENTQKEE